MENEINFNYLDPEMPLVEGMQYPKYISKETAQKMFPNQPEYSYAEDQKCNFCMDSNNIISKETCCTGCSVLRSMNK